MRAPASALLLLSILGTGDSFFAPSPSFSRVNTRSSPVKPLFSDQEGLQRGPEKEIDVEEEVRKQVMVRTNLRNKNGVDYAPWMAISEEDEAEIRQIVADKKAARDRRKEEEKETSGNLYLDSQAQELSGVGLRAKVVEGTSVELTWTTQNEANTLGYEVRRRVAKEKDWILLASCDDYAPLKSKSTEGGTYRYLDGTSEAGGYVYRITEKETSGSQSDLCQTLVEIETDSQKRAGLVAGILGPLLIAGAVYAGLTLDPM